MKPKLNIAMVGGGFMGKAHSNAWRRVGQFFDIPFEPVLKVIVGNNAPVEDFAARWGYEEISYDWRSLEGRKDIDIVDIVTPPVSHKDIALMVAGMKAHMLCEKPIALNSADAKAMLDAANKAGIVHYLNHNYRRIPAVCLAKRMIEENRLGQLYHWRGAYLQDWTMD
ncbi:Gfo/Idh/MocA family oxidoreductase, partial [Eubacteriales bacterium OttesenSCG-928-K08]|nr:Gfo/Idh/MocA family oxidoreductase [Eubacteriales bacterium OttesenSCG-928-K08]